MAAPKFRVIGGRRAALRLRRLPGRAVPPAEPRPNPGPQPGAAATAAQRLNEASGLVALSVLLDSGMEHYRGEFHNKVMFAPLISAGLSLAAGAHGSRDKRAAAHPLRDTIYAVTGLVAVIGTAFHIYNVGKRPGGFSMQNLFYAAPIGAPTALMISGGLGFLAERTRDNAPGAAPQILGLPAGRALAGATGVGLVGTVGEAGLLHLRGAYHDPFMFLPVSVPPVAAALLGAAALGRRRRDRPLTRNWLRVTAALGLIGSAFHVIGVGRNMGGWRNWRQNLLAGPPIPAPPAFTGLALAGLAALELMGELDDG